MFGVNPLQLEKPLKGESLCEAVRLALIAELDAINIYRQIARYASDPLFKRVFEEVAEEEKEHMGEFMYLLRKCDSTIAGMMEEGEKEAREAEEAVGRVE